MKTKNLLLITALQFTLGINIFAQIEPDIYVMNELGRVWKNGEQLFDHCGYTYDMAVATDGSVYTAGFDGDMDEREVAMVWKNGEPLYQLSDVSHNARIHGIAIADNNDIYVCGYVEDANHIGTTTVWNNGKLRSSRWSMNENFYVHGITVAGNSVYVSGKKNERALVWRISNAGVADHFLGPSGSNNSANDVAVSPNGTFYACGEEKEDDRSVGKVWENGREKYMLSNTNADSWKAYSIALSADGTIYTSGYSSKNGNEAATVWKNDQQLYTLTAFGEYNEGRSIALHENNIYIGGSENDCASVWKNNNKLPYKLEGSIIRKVCVVNPISNSIIEKKIDTDMLKVYTDKEGIVIQSTLIGEIMHIYNVSGEKIADIIIEGNETRIPMQKGIYIVRIGEYATKIILP